MSADTWLIARDPVSARDLFEAACAAAGNPKRRFLFDSAPGFNDVHQYRAWGGRRAKASVSVHFPPGGTLYPAELELDEPDGYARVCLCAGSYFGKNQDALWQHHAGLVRRLGQWLDTRRIRWCWSFEGDPWIHGTVPATRPQEM